MGHPMLKNPRCISAPPSARPVKIHLMANSEGVQKRSDPGTGIKVFE
jgi:hypothetical protein